MTEASKIAAGNKTMDDELIETVARGLEKSLAWDVEKDVYAGETTHEERCAISRAILPIARKHYAEVFAKVAAGYETTGSLVPATGWADESVEWWETGVSDASGAIAAAIRKAGEA